MPQTLLEGPVIAGKPNGYPRYWTIRKSKSTVKRKKPQGLDIIKSPTAYASNSTHQSTDPDYSPTGELLTPALGVWPPNPTAFPNPIKIAVKDKAVNALMVKVKDEKWNLSTFLGELPQTMKYFREVGREIVDLYIAVKRRRITRKRLRRLARKGLAYLRNRGVPVALYRGSGKLSQRWLEYRYAISPLVYDFQDSLTYLHSSASKPVIDRSAGGAGDNWTYLSSDPVYKKMYQGSIQGRAVMYYSVNIHAAALKRLGLINLAATLWELTPFSFVVDRFLPVGDFLGNLDAMAGVTVLSSTYSERLDLVAVRPQYARADGGTVGGSRGTYKGYSRSVGLPRLPALPTFSHSPSGKFTLDLAALLRNVVLGR